MDFLMPDDATAQKMCEEYASCLKNKAHSLAYINETLLDETEQTLLKMKPTLPKNGKRHCKTTVASAYFARVRYKSFIPLHCCDFGI